MSFRGFLVLAGLVAGSAGLPAVRTETEAAQLRDRTYWRVDGNRLVLGNPEVEIELDSRSGALSRMRNKHAKLEFRVPENCAWPFGVHTGTVDEPHLQQMEIRGDYQQAMTYSVSRGEGNGGLTLQMLYANLRDNKTNEASGVQLTVWLTIRPGSNYFTIKASLLNRGDRQITEFYAWKGAGLTTGDGTTGRLTLPYGAEQPNVEKLNRGISVQSPSIFLSMGWADLSGSRGGIGIGYLNHQDVPTALKIKQGDRATELSWTFFNLEPITSNFRLHRHPAIYPLGPGERFDTDEWILVLHDGDWHQTADAYRERYDAVFAGDYLTWDKVSTAAKRIDLWAGMKTMSWATWTPNSLPKDFAFDTHMRPTMRDLSRKFDVRPENVMVSSTQGLAGPKLPLPDLHVCADYAGGCDAYARMVKQLREDGYAGILSYVFYWDQYVGAKTYTPEAIPSIPQENKSLPEKICLDNWSAFKAWHDVIMPGFTRIGVNAAYFDLGSMPTFLCEDAKHIHGDKSLGILTAGTRGIRRMTNAFHAALGPESMLVTEAKDDVRGRYYDIWHGPTSEMLRYSHPTHLVALDAEFIGGGEGQTVYLSKEFKKIASAGQLASYALLTGCQLITTPKSLEPENLDQTRQFVRLRRELRAASAPGYPLGFRDTVGVTVGARDLDARVFTDREGITIVYYNWGKENVEGLITVNGQQLNVLRIGIRKHSVKLRPGEAGFLVMR